MISVNNAQGMLAFWIDIDEDYVLRFQEWHNFEHMAERINIPGILVGRRYRGFDDAPMFFISYETTESAVFGMQPYMERINNPTSWTREALSHFNNNIRNTYRLLACSGRQAPQEAPYVLIWRFNIINEETVEWFGSKLLPDLQTLPGVFRTRFFEVDEEISNIKTTERAIYGGGPKEQKYLAYFEIAQPNIHQSVEWKTAIQTTPHREKLANLKNIFEEVSWLEFAMYSPDVS
ncbi:MAG: hypothetical protein ABIL06_19265 [Pseudomonadota bacterium]